MDLPVSIIVKNIHRYFILSDAIPFNQQQNKILSKFICSIYLKNISYFCSSNTGANEFGNKTSKNNMTYMAGKQEWCF